MSGPPGMVGWFSAEPAAMPLEEMAAPPGGAHPLRSARHRLGAAALSAGPEEASLYHQDGLLIVHWGERRDATAALARLWRTHGAGACAALSGHFAFALLDEGRAEALLAVDRCATRPLFYQMAGRSLLTKLGARRACAAGAPVLPFGRWLLGDARLRALAYYSVSSLARRGILRRDFVDQLLARRLPEDPAAHGETVWRLLMLEQWLARGRRGGFDLDNRPDLAAQPPASASYTAR